MEVPLGSFLLSGILKNGTVVSARSVWQSVQDVDNFVVGTATVLKHFLWKTVTLHHYNFPGADTGTKEGRSCRFKKDVFSRACQVAVRIISFFPSSVLWYKISKCDVRRGGASQYRYLREAKHGLLCHCISAQAWHKIGLLIYFLFATSHVDRRTKNNKCMLYKWSLKPKTYWQCDIGTVLTPLNDKDVLK